ncbi:MAG: rhizopine-binding protein [Spirochaetes bacterium]|nr:MAG: rhizopine-binding protein [Spirochaetota bacterium]
MKRIVSLLIVLLVFSASMGLWANGGSEGDTLHIGVATANFDDKWMSYMHDGFRAAADEFGVKITMVDGKNDPAVQQSQIDTLITQGVDAIVIVSVDAKSIGPILDETDKAGIPLVSVNRIPDEPYLSRLATYVGSDELYAGTVQAEKIAELLGGKGNVVIMNGELGHPGMLGRTKGNKDVIAANPGMTIVRENTAEWSRAKGLELMENWIQTGVQIDAVLANNDEMAIGAAMALEQVGMLDQVLIAGVDATPDALMLMKEGKLDVTVFQDAYGQGYGGIEAAIKAAKGEDLPKIWDIPYEIVTPDLADEYLAR